MTATFGFSFNAKEFGEYCKTFQASDDEEYAVHVNFPGSHDPHCSSHRMHSYNNSSQYCTLSIQWKKKCNKIIRIKSYRAAHNDILSEAHLFVKDELKVSTGVKTSMKNITVFVIDITPYADIPRLVDDTQSAEKQNLNETETVIEKRLEQLSTDMKHLLQTGNLSDVILTNGSEEILAHKLVLSVRSIVFAKMFEHPMKENRENRITIRDIPIDVLKGLLNFMYSGTAVLKDIKMARDLYVAADKYNVQDLKNICSDMLKSASLNNVLDTLLLADLYSDEVLKEAMLTYIASNYTQLKTGPNWGRFMKENQTLAIEILSFVLDKKV